MNEAERLPAYRKEHSEEDFLRRLNGQLEGEQRALEDAGPAEPTLPVVFVIGAPRSGTTLVSQLLAYAGCFGHVSNFVARFWLAPAVGARLERSLGAPGLGEKPSFESAHGVTRGWTAPHEFGYFWSHWFDLGQETHKLSRAELDGVDGARLRRRVASLEAVRGGPLVFKNNTWCTFQADYLAQLFARSIFVVCRRDPLFLAQSILMARRERYGDEKAWWSVRPSCHAQLKDLPWWEQIAGQVTGILRDMDDAVVPIPAARIVEADYARVCADPNALVRAVIEQCIALGAPMPVSRPLPTRFEGTDRMRVAEEDLRRLRGALERRSS